VSGNSAFSIHHSAFSISFTLNGSTISVEADPADRLLDTLRYRLGLTGTKEGCGEGECGACTVYLDGLPVNSCLVPIYQVRGCRVETVESLDPAALQPLLVAAARQVGAVQIQARGTWAGNIVNASPAADGVPVLMAYDAVVVLESVRGRVEVPLAEFYAGYKQMRRAVDELVVEIRVPRRAYALQRFFKVGARRAQAIAKVGLAVTRSAAGWRVVAASMAPVAPMMPISCGLSAGTMLPAVASSPASRRSLIVMTDISPSGP
jgi:xanthine dehydrogenase iron-sulfur cluster and FAD-binding subunit A